MRWDKPDGPTGSPTVPREGSGGRDAPLVGQKTGDLGATAGPPICPHPSVSVLRVLFSNHRRGAGDPCWRTLGEIGTLIAWEILSIYFLSTAVLSH